MQANSQSGHARRSQSVKRTVQSNANFHVAGDGAVDGSSAAKLLVVGNTSTIASFLRQASTSNFGPGIGSAPDHEVSTREKSNMQRCQTSSWQWFNPFPKTSINSKPHPQERDGKSNTAPTQHPTITCFYDQLAWLAA